MHAIIGKTVQNFLFIATTKSPTIMKNESVFPGLSLFPSMRSLAKTRFERACC